MHLYSLCQTWLNLKTHTVSETENRTSCLTTLVKQPGGRGGGGGSQSPPASPTGSSTTDKNNVKIMPHDPPWRRTIERTCPLPGYVSRPRDRDAKRAQGRDRGSPCT